MEKEVSEYESVPVQDVRRAMTLMADPPGQFYLLEVRLFDTNTGEALPPNLVQSLGEAGVDLGIHWFAIREANAVNEILFTALYAEKFQKLIRKWNRAGSRFRFEIDIKKIRTSTAVSFYMTAAYQQGELIRAALKHRHCWTFDV